MYGPAPSGGGGAGIALPLLDSRVEVTVHGAIAEVVVHQTFHNDADHVTEATYIFPLPEDAAVSALAITTGARTIHAAIAARAEAQKRYEDAVTAGVGAALLEQERPDVFTQTVSAIPARGDVEITLRYDTVARPRGDGTWQLALPMVVAPRYVPGTASGRSTTGAGHAPDTDRAPDASRVTPGGRPNAGGPTTIAIAFADAVEDVTSPTHDLAARGSGYALADAHSDRDALIRWRGRQPASGWSEQDGAVGYAAVVVSAPAARARAPGGTALDVALVLDRSAAAHGDADAMERPLVRELLADLTPADGVTVTGSAAIARAAPADAWRELDRSWATSPGAFDLTRALAAAHGGAVVLVTPGLVADDAAALAAARALKTPVHVVGVGPAPNRALLLAIARDTGGTLRFIAPDDDATAIARDLVSDLASPPAALAVNWGALAAAEVVPATLPHLGAGQARLVLARIAAAKVANGRARGDVFAIAVLPKPLDVRGAVTPLGPLARRWARDTLGEMLVGPPDVAAVTAFALRYGLVSPYTSMVAIGDEVVVVGGVKHTVSVPVSVPAGMKWQPLEHELHVATKGEKNAEDPQDVDRKQDRKGPPSRPRDQAKKEQGANGTDARPHGGSPKQRPAPEPAPDHAPATTPKKPLPSRQPAPVAPSAPAPAPSPPPATTAAGPPADALGGEDTEAATAATGADADDADPGARAKHAGQRAQEIAAVETERSPEDMPTPGMRHRYGLALGGGAILSRDPRAFVAFTASLDLGGTYRAHDHLRWGAAASLWLVDGPHAQGRLLGTLTWWHGRTGVEAGLGLHVSDAAGVEVGPALGVALRHVFARHLTGYLRYDGALLFGNGGHADEHAASAGVEWRW